MIALVCALVFAPSRLDKTILASDSKVLKVGRFDEPAPGVERASWSASTVVLKVHGSYLKTTVESDGDNYVQVEVNGEPKDVWHAPKGDQAFTINLPAGDNTVRLTKRTEAFCGPISYPSFSTDAAGKFLPPPPRPHLIEVVGDSITCGFGDEGKTENDPFLTATENADASYATVAARNLNAEATLIAWSGRTMWPENTMPSIYDLTIPTDPTTFFAFARHRAPDVVLINLATNDFRASNPDRASWCGAYEAFLHKLRGLYPKARLYCAMGSMMQDGYPPKQLALTTLRGYLQAIVADEKQGGDNNVGMIEFEVQKKEDGIGAAWHPSLKTHQIMAAKMAEALRKDLNWK